MVDPVGGRPSGRGLQAVGRRLAAAAALLVWMATELYDRGRSRPPAGLSFIGTVSLFIFAFGNILLVLAQRLPFHDGHSLAAEISLLAAVIALSGLFWKSLTIGRARVKSGGRDALANGARAQGAVVGVIAALVEPIGGVYASVLWREKTAIRHERMGDGREPR